MNRLALICFICLIDFIVVRSACPVVPGYDLSSISGQSVTGYAYGVHEGQTLDYTICGTINQACGTAGEVCADHPTNCTGVCQRWVDLDDMPQAVSLGRFQSATVYPGGVSLLYTGGDTIEGAVRVTYINLTCDTAATTLRTDGFVQPGTDGPFIYTILASHAALCHTPPHAPVAPPTEPPQAPPDGELLNYCLNNFSGLPIPGEISPCLHIKKTGCFDLTAEVRMGDKVLFGPRELPFRLILLSGKSQYCMEDIQMPAVGGLSIRACVNLTKLTYNETLKRLNVCSSISVSSSVLPIGRTIDLKCIDINDCDLPKVCPKACSSVGTCNMGVCKCNEGHYGLDCSYSTKDNCLDGTDTHTCWTPKQGSCGQVDVEISQQGQPTIHVFKNIGPSDDAVIEFPCNQTAPDKFDCKDCFSFKNVKVVGKSLQGYPSFDLMCGNILVNSKQSKTPVTLVQTYKTDCQVPPPTVDPRPPTPAAGPVPAPLRPPPVAPSPQAPLPDPPVSFIDLAKQNKGTLIIAAVVVVVILIALVGVGFYFYKRCVRQTQASSSGYYQGLEEIDPLDSDGPIDPDGGDADAVDYSFESTDSD